MPSHVDVLDKFKVEHRTFDSLVVLLCRSDKVIEIHAVDDEGLEEFAGVLNRHHKAGQKKLDVLLQAIARHVAEDPVSKRALAWLSALDYVGFLK